MTGKQTHPPSTQYSCHTAVCDHVLAHRKQGHRAGAHSAGLQMGALPTAPNCDSQCMSSTKSESSVVTAAMQSLSTRSQTLAPDTKYFSETSLKWLPSVTARGRPKFADLFIRPVNGK